MDTKEKERAARVSGAVTLLNRHAAAAAMERKPKTVSARRGRISFSCDCRYKVKRTGEDKGEGGKVAGISYLRQSIQSLNPSIINERHKSVLLNAIKTMENVVSSDDLKGEKTYFKQRYKEILGYVPLRIEKLLNGVTLTEQVDGKHAAGGGDKPYKPTTAGVFIGNLNTRIESDKDLKGRIGAVTMSDEDENSATLHYTVNGKAKTRHITGLRAPTRELASSVLQGLRQEASGADTRTDAGMDTLGRADCVCVCCGGRKERTGGITWKQRSLPGISMFRRSNNRHSSNLRSLNSASAY